jgi:hypothetical protein
MAAAGNERAQKEVAEYQNELEAFAYYRKHGKMPEGSANAGGFRESMFAIAAKYDSLPQFHGYGYVDGMEGAYDRTDAFLVAAVEALQDGAGGECAKLRVVEIPDGTDYEIEEYDGNEHIAEKHRTWR